MSNPSRANAITSTAAGSLENGDPKDALPMFLLDAMLNGLVLGGIYALIALGLTLQYGVARIMNLSYGEFLVAAAFFTYTLFTAFSISPLVSLVAIVPVAFLVNWALFRLMLAPLLRRAKNQAMLEVDSILITFGLLFVVQGLLLILFGGEYYGYSYFSIPIEILGSTLAANRLIASAFAVVIACALYLALTRTRLGTAIRAVAISMTSAQLVGINIAVATAFAFALGGTLVATAGVLVSMFFTFNAVMGVVFTLKALVIVIMGGVGNLLGALVAGLLLGIAEALVAALIDPGLTLAVNYLLFLAVLLFRPTGLFGKSVQ